MLGPEQPGVTLVEYGDFECPYCRAAYPAVKDVGRRMAGELRVVFRHLPIASRHPHAVPAAEASEAAAQEGRFWQMHDLLYEHQDALGDDDLRAHARRLGLDLERFTAALADHRHLPRVERDVESARRSGASSTPSFFLDGEPYEGFYDAESLEDAARAALGA